MLSLSANTKVLLKEQQRHFRNASFQRRAPKSEWPGKLFPIDSEEMFYNFMDDERIKDPTAFQTGLLSAMYIACRCKVTETWTREDVESLEKMVFRMAAR